ncbi:MAG: heat-inducible transcription repressor HrcA [Clostridia bacterium]|nr:heat-inducible transcription repressor HrcA [Clostridia bacterium]
MSAYSGELSERKKLILKAVVEAHIEGGEPVGSKYIVQNNLVSCSSATIRNEMAELEALGYLEQPHTSAGRVPSELGYRFYVDSLVEHYANTTKDIAKINHLLKMKMTEIDQILETASKLASSLTNYTGIAIKPRASSVTMSRFEVIPIDAHNFAMVMITASGMVKTKKVKTLIPYSTEALSKLSDFLNTNICGLDANMITLPIIMDFEREMGDHAHLVTHTVKAIYEIMNELDGGKLKYSGINRLLDYPEYADTQQLSNILGTLEDPNEILELVSNIDNDEINVLIGSESPVKVMNNSAMVFKPITNNGKIVGIIGILGPRRMDYKKVLQTIEEIGAGITGMIDGERALGAPNTDGGEDNG